MKSLRFLPLAFVADVHGFALFAPYLAFAITIVHLLWALRRRRFEKANLVNSKREFRQVVDYPEAQSPVALTA